MATPDGKKPKEEEEDEEEEEETLTDVSKTLATDTYDLQHMFAANNDMNIWH